MRQLVEPRKQMKAEQWRQRYDMNRQARIKLAKGCVKVFDSRLSYLVFDDGSVYEEYTTEIFTPEEIVTAYDGAGGVQRELYEAVMTIYGVGKTCDADRG